MSLFILLVLIFGNQLDEYSTQRKRMVETQILSRGITDHATLDAMIKVPRHLFIPRESWSNAYADGPVLIGHGQTISQPYIVAYMTECLRLEAHDTVLEIGTGSGYQAAILAEIVSKVFTIEIIEALGKEAAKRLRTLGYENVTVLVGDGFFGYRECAPYDAIMVTAAPDKIPPALLDQLKDGGRLIAPVGAEHEIQNLVLVEKKGQKTITRKLAPVRFVPFTRSGKETE
jgi:protein-L-isoaspartate(D-aspartate) O-methyltransferase